MADTLRRLVPTERQRDVGDAGDYRQVVETQVDAEGTPRSRRTRLWHGLRDLDPRTIEGPRLVFLVLCLTSVTARIDEQAIGVLLPQIRADLGLNVAFLGNVAAVSGILLTLAALPLGYLADRVSRVWLVRSGTFLTGVTIGLTGLATNALGLVGARLTNGVAQGIAQPASFPLMADYFPPRGRARVFSIYLAAAQLGLIAGPAIAGVLGDQIGWRSTLLLLASLAVAAALLTLLLKEPPRGRFDGADAGQPLLPPPSFGEAYRAAASVSTLRRFWYATPFVGSRGVFGLLLLPLFLSEVYGISTTELGLIFALNGITGMVGILAAGPLGAYLLRERPGRFMTVLGFAPIVQAAVILLVSFRPPLVVAILVLQVSVICEVIGQPGGYTLISFVVPARVRGLGLQTTAPWQLLNLILLPVLLAAMHGYGLQHGIRLLVPLLVIGGVILATAAPGVERDIRAARAADAAGAAAADVGEGTTALVLRDVDVAYDGVPVLFNVDLDVRRGEVLALVGTNGSGKSTLLRAIGGTQEASNGAIFFDGRDITHLPPHEIAALGVVTMPGGNAVFPSLTVAENLRAAAWTVAADSDLVATRTEQVLELFPVLRDRLGQQAGTLSGGEQQMVGLSQALLMGPRLLMVDELSLGLAPRVVEQLLAVLRALNQRGTTIVLVEQSLNVALTIADRAVFMEKGTVRFEGPTTELLRRPDLIRSVFMGGAAGGTRAARRTTFVPGDSTKALEVEGVSVSFGGIQALRDVTLGVEPGQVVGVIGPNGAGKTTLFDVISGFVSPDSGTVRIDGTDVGQLSADQRARRGLGRSFQNARLFPALTVRENIAVALERRAVKSPVLGALWAPQVRSSERRIAKQVERLVDLMGLATYADSVLSELSTGSRRAVDVACIIALEPTVLLLDEPSSGLAQAETEALGPLLTRIVKETGCGMLVIEHDIPLITSLSDQLVAMESGLVLMTGSPDEVRNDPRVLSSYLAASDDVIERTDTTRTASPVAAVAGIFGHDSKEQ